ncbi:MAG: hypothetical protein SFT81_05450 [Candidatus Caenarcaniphilales bacterium]|nr:hypothetical protein [Candidatus Caenarcaniphilales bacterium]
MTKAIDERSVSPSQEFSNLAFRFNNLNSTAKMLLVGSTSNAVPYIPISDLVNGNPLAYSEEQFSLSKLAKPIERIDVVSSVAEKPKIHYKTTTRIERAWSVDELVQESNDSVTDHAEITTYNSALNLSPEPVSSNYESTEYFEKLSDREDYERVFPLRAQDIERSPWFNPVAAPEEETSKKSKTSSGLGSFIRKTITPVAIVSGLVLLAVTSFNLFKQIQKPNEQTIDETSEVSNSIDFYKEGQIASGKYNQGFEQNFYDEIASEGLIGGQIGQSNSSNNQIASSAPYSIRNRTDLSSSSATTSQRANQGLKIAPKSPLRKVDAYIPFQTLEPKTTPKLDIEQIAPSISYLEETSQFQALLPTDQFPVHIGNYNDIDLNSEENLKQAEEKVAQEQITSSSEATLSPQPESELSNLEENSQSEALNQTTEDTLSEPTSKINQTNISETTSAIETPTAEPTAPIEDKTEKTTVEIGTNQLPVQSTSSDALDIEPLLRTPLGGVQPIEATTKSPAEVPASKMEAYDAEKQLQLYQAQLIGLQAKAQSSSLTRIEKRALLNDVNTLKQKILKVNQELQGAKSQATKSTIKRTSAIRKNTGISYTQSSATSVNQKTSSQRSTEQLNQLENDVRQIYRGG